MPVMMPAITFSALIGKSLTPSAVTAAAEVATTANVRPPTTWLRTSRSTPKREAERRSQRDVPEQGEVGRVHRVPV